MQIEPQITFRDMQPSAAIEYAIRERLTRLENFHDRITSCRVVVQAPHRHGQKGRIYRIAIDIDVPGGNVVVNREPGQNHAHEDIHVAIRDAFSAAQRQLEDHVRKASGWHCHINRRISQLGQLGANVRPPSSHFAKRRTMWFEALCNWAV
jgi:ribosomal subunit interface protein